MSSVCPLYETLAAENEGVPISVLVLFENR
jgi:hypothetical protein